MESLPNDATRRYSALPEPTAAERRYEETHNFQGFGIASLRRLFGGVCNQQDWTGPWKAEVRRADLPMVRAAAKYFHGDEVTVAAETNGTVAVAGAGLQRW